MSTLEFLYVTPKNKVFARYLLATRKQQNGETLDEYLNKLKLLSKDCEFQAVTADVYQKEMIRDSFINGLQFPYIRQRLLENTTLNLDDAFSQARSLESAQKNAESYNINPNGTVNAVAKYSNLSDNDEDTNNLNAVSKKYIISFVVADVTTDQSVLQKMPPVITVGKMDILRKYVCLSQLLLP